TNLGWGYINSKDAPRWVFLVAGDGWAVKDGTKDAFVTDGTLEIIETAVERLRAAGQLPVDHSNDLRITSAALAAGANNPPHDSHQTGLDVDFGLNPPGVWFTDTSAATYLNIDFPPPSTLSPYLWSRVAAYSSGAYTNTTARNMIVPIEVWNRDFVVGPPDADLGKLDKSLDTLYTHRGTNDPFDRAVRSFAPPPNDPNEPLGAKFDRGFDFLFKRPDYSRTKVVQQI